MNKVKAKTIEAPMKRVTLYSVLMTLLTSSCLLFGGDDAWRAFVCAQAQASVVPIELPDTPITPVSVDDPNATAPWGIAISPDGTTAVITSAGF